LKSASGPRDLNEDTAFIKDFTSRARQTRYLCVGLVADGMGGHRAGEVASSEAVQTFFEMFNAKKIPYEQDYGLDTKELMHDIFSSVNTAVYDVARRDNKLKGMGTTLTAFIAERDVLTIGHVGDTRAYLVRKGSITQLTQDHTLVENMVRDGIITREQASVRSDRNVITRAVGVDPTVEVDILSVPIEPGDVVFLCSDGLYDVVNNQDILIHLNNAENMQEACQELVRIAVANGTTDNVTAVAWEVPGTVGSASYPAPDRASRDTLVLAPRGRRRDLPLEDIKIKRRRRILAIALLVLVVLVGFLLGWLLAGWVKNRGSGSQGAGRVETVEQAGTAENGVTDLRKQTYVVLLNAAGSTGDPAQRAQQVISGLGYAGVSTSTVKSASETKTKIYYGQGDREKADLVAEDLHLEPGVNRFQDQEVVRKHSIEGKEADVVVVLSDDWDIP